MNLKYARQYSGVLIVSSLRFLLVILLLGCHGRPSLKMGLVFFFFSSGEKLQFLRNFACIRFNNDAAAV